MLLFVVTIILVLYPIFRAIYNITYHPLAKYPGPRLHAAFTFPYVYRALKGDLPKRVNDYHNKYGSVVRISPNELSFVSAQAWRDIHGVRHPQNPKDLMTYLPPDEYEGKRMVMELSDVKHQAQRHQLSPAFSPKALLEYQPLLNDYVDQLISSIRSKIPHGQPLDLVAYLNWTTFDIIGHLTFGESFHCLDTSSYHPWTRVIFDGVAAGLCINQFARYGLLNIIMALIPKSMQKPRDDMLAYSNARMDERLKVGFGHGTRRDFAYYMRNGPDTEDSGKASAHIETMDRDTMCAQGETLIIAGSETTATVLSGAMFLLLTKRPEYLAQIKTEVRTAFEDDSLGSMDFRHVNEKLPLLIAALKEALRYYPPVCFGLARTFRNPSGARTVDGNPVPANTSVSISQWAANHHAYNWHRPDDFLPERWLDDASLPGSPFANDQREACQPFSVGPRNCLGKPLADIETRLIFAKLIYNFDFKLVDGQDDWIDRQTQSIIWGKGPLMVRFKDVEAEA